MLFTLPFVVSPQMAWHTAIFCTSHREYMKKLKRYLRQTYEAGERVFVDYAGPAVQIRDIKKGETGGTQLFVGVLGALNYIYAGVVWNHRRENWIPLTDPGCRGR